MSRAPQQSYREESQAAAKIRAIRRQMQNQQRMGGGGGGFMRSGDDSNDHAQLLGLVHQGPGSAADGGPTFTPAVRVAGYGGTTGFGITPQSNYPAMVELFSANGAPPVSTAEQPTIPFELFEAVQERLSLTKTAHEKSEADLASKIQENNKAKATLAVANDEINVLKAKVKAQQEQLDESRKQNTMLVELVSSTDLKMAKLQDYNSDLQLKFEEKVKELNVKNYKTSDALVAMAQKDSVILALKRENGDLARRLRRMEGAGGVGFDDDDDEDGAGNHYNALLGGEVSTALGSSEFGASGDVDGNPITALGTKALAIHRVTGAGGTSPMSASDQQSTASSPQQHNHNQSAASGSNRKGNRLRAILNEMVHSNKLMGDGAEGGGGGSAYTRARIEELEAANKMMKDDLEELSRAYDEVRRRAEDTARAHSEHSMELEDTLMRIYNANTTGRAAGVGSSYFFRSGMAAASGMGGSVLGGGGANRTSRSGSLAPGGGSMSPHRNASLVPRTTKAADDGAGDGPSAPQPSRFTALSENLKAINQQLLGEATYTEFAASGLPVVSTTLQGVSDLTAVVNDLCAMLCVIESDAAAALSIGELREALANGVDPTGQGATAIQRRMREALATIRSGLRTATVEEMESRLAKAREHMNNGGGAVGADGAAAPTISSGSNVHHQVGRSGRLTIVEENGGLAVVSAAASRTGSLGRISRQSSFAAGGGGGPRKSICVTDLNDALLKRSGGDGGAKSTTTATSGSIAQQRNGAGAPVFPLDSPIAQHLLAVCGGGGSVSNLPSGAATPSNASSPSASASRSLGAVQVLSPSKSNKKPTAAAVGDGIMSDRIIMSGNNNNNNNNNNPIAEMHSSIVLNSIITKRLLLYGAGLQTALEVALKLLSRKTNSSAAPTTTALDGENKNNGEGDNVVTPPPPSQQRRTHNNVILADVMPQQQQSAAALLLPPEALRTTALLHPFLKEAIDIARGRHGTTGGAAGGEDLASNTNTKKKQHTAAAATDGMSSANTSVGNESQLLEGTLASMPLNTQEASDEGIVAALEDYFEAWLSMNVQLLDGNVDENGAIGDYDSQQTSSTLKLVIPDYLLKVAERSTASSLTTASATLTLDDIRRLVEESASALGMGMAARSDGPSNSAGADANGGNRRKMGPTAAAANGVVVNRTNSFGSASSLHAQQRSGGGGGGALGLRAQQPSKGMASNNRRQSLAANSSNASGRAGPSSSSAIGLNEDMSSVALSNSTNTTASASLTARGGGGGKQTHQRNHNGNTVINTSTPTFGVFGNGAGGGDHLVGGMITSANPLGMKQNANLTSYSNSLMSGVVSSASHYHHHQHSNSGGGAASPGHHQASSPMGAGVPPSSRQQRGVRGGAGGNTAATSPMSSNSTTPRGVGGHQASSPSARKAVPSPNAKHGVSTGPLTPSSGLHRSDIRTGLPSANEGEEEGEDGGAGGDEHTSGDDALFFAGASAEGDSPSPRRRQSSVSSRQQTSPTSGGWRGAGTLTSTTTGNDGAFTAVNDSFANGNGKPFKVRENDQRESTARRSRSLQAFLDRQGSVGRRRGSPPSGPQSQNYVYATTMSDPQLSDGGGDGALGGGPFYKTTDQAQFISDSELQLNRGAFNARPNSNSRPSTSPVSGGGVAGGGRIIGGGGGYAAGNRHSSTVLSTLVVEGKRSSAQQSPQEVALGVGTSPRNDSSPRQAGANGGRVVFGDGSGSGGGGFVARGINYHGVQPPTNEQQRKVSMAFGNSNNALLLEGALVGKGRDDHAPDPITHSTAGRSRSISGTRVGSVFNSLSPRDALLLSLQQQQQEQQHGATNTSPSAVAPHNHNHHTRSPPRSRRSIEQQELTVQRQQMHMPRGVSPPRGYMTSSVGNNSGGPIQLGIAGIGVNLSPSRSNPPAASVGDAVTSQQQQKQQQRYPNQTLIDVNSSSALMAQSPYIIQTLPENRMAYVMAPPPPLPTHLNAGAAPLASGDAHPPAPIPTAADSNSFLPPISNSLNGTTSSAQRPSGGAVAATVAASPSSPTIPPNTAFAFSATKRAVSPPKEATSVNGIVGGFLPAITPRKGAVASVGKGSQQQLSSSEYTTPFADDREQAGDNAISSSSLSTAEASNRIKLNVGGTSSSASGSPSSPSSEALQRQLLLKLQQLNGGESIPSKSTGAAAVGGGGALDGIVATSATAPPQISASVTVPSLRVEPAASGHASSVTQAAMRQRGGGGGGGASPPSAAAPVDLRVEPSARRPSQALPSTAEEEGDPHTTLATLRKKPLTPTAPAGSMRATGLANSLTNRGGAEGSSSSRVRRGSAFAQQQHGGAHTTPTWCAAATGLVVQNTAKKGGGVVSQQQPIAGAVEGDAEDDEDVTGAALPSPPMLVQGARTNTKDDHHTNAAITSSSSNGPIIVPKHIQALMDRKDAAVGSVGGNRASHNRSDAALGSEFQITGTVASTANLTLGPGPSAERRASASPPRPSAQEPPTATATRRPGAVPPSATTTVAQRKGSAGPTPQLSITPSASLGGGVSSGVRGGAAIEQLVMKKANEARYEQYQSELLQQAQQSNGSKERAK